MGERNMNYDLIVENRRGGTIHQGDDKSAMRATPQFDLVVLCAEEFQPPVHEVAAKRALYAPNDDGDVITQEQKHLALLAAEEVALAFTRGEQVLVTCMQGRNRSGLVTALAIHLVYGIGGARAAHWVKRRRRGAAALTNPIFMSYLTSLSPNPSTHFYPAPAV